MTVEFTVLEYLTYMVVSFGMGVGVALLGLFIYHDVKRGIIREAKEEARKQR